MTAKDLEIKEVDSIIAIEILEDSYKIPVIKYSKKEIRYIRKLLKYALESTKLQE